ncbi:MAG: flagellar type III secretion system pore protein FliP [Roseburia sp.]|nr:flagellar type III secretion system pore protein FliP [Roseburia sp.]
MKDTSKKYNIKHELRKLLYMLFMVVTIATADVVVANATANDDITAGEILDNRPEEDTNRTNINEPGSAQTPEDLADLNISNSLTFTYGSGNGELNGTLRLMLIVTAIAVVPILLVTITSFTRILIVLHFTRQALNTQSAPPNQVLIAIALFLTFFIMQPVFSQIYTEAVLPFDAGELEFEEALEIGAAPMRQFMFDQAQREDIATFMEISNTPWDGETMDQVPTSVLIPGFIISELRSAFIMGFVIYVPFIVIDMVVASVLMSMGMMMLPPTTISMPFKILLFVLADGWNLIIVYLVRTFM